MKNKPGSPWKLGAFITAGLVVLVAGLFFIGKQKNLFVPMFPVKAQFSNVSGLREGSAVRFGGINIGSVEGIRLVNDTSVMVNLMVKEEVHRFIKRDASVTIASDGLMGDRVVLIVPGAGNEQPVNANEILVSKSPVETDQILAGLKTSADNAAIITQQLSEIAYKVNHGKGVIGKLISDSSVANNLKATMSNLRQGSQGLSENMEAAKHNFLLRGFFKKKKREAERKKKEQEEKAREEQENSQKTPEPKN